VIGLRRTLRDLRDAHRRVAQAGGAWNQTDERAQFAWGLNDGGLLRVRDGRIERLNTHGVRVRTYPLTEGDR
jgi:hypothetical protein